MNSPVHRRRTAPATVRRPHPTVWARALQLAGGDPRRLQLLPDNSVLVVNQPRTSKWSPRGR
jgi:hypothetical protein